MALIRICLIALALSAPVPGIAQDIPARVVDSLSSWAAARGGAEFQVAIAYRGEVKARFATAGDAGPVDIASLSKAITASCVADLVANGQMEWSARVGQYLPELPAPLADVILSDLVTHDAGLWPDSNQGPMAEWRGAGAPVHGAVAESIARRPLVDMTYRYNNENYAVLGAVIEAVSDTSYAETCATRVFDRIGVTSAEASPLFGRFAAWGGWRIDPGDYARFIWARFGDSDPGIWPFTPSGGGTHYGLGMVWRSFGDGFNHWHFGALCFADGPNFLTHSVLFANGWGVVTRVEGCPQDDWYVSLDAAVIDGVFP